VGAGELIFDRVVSSLLKCRWIGGWQNLFIAVVTTLVTLIAMAFGGQIRDLLPSRMPDILGGTLLVVFAAWNVYRERPGASAFSSMPISRFAERKSLGMVESLFLSGALSINNVGLAIVGGIGGVSYVSAAMSIFCFSMAMLALGQTVGSNFTRARSVPRVLRYPMSGNAVLALVGILMLAGY
jgi:putative Mn2+ efflux pump MntP